MIKNWPNFSAILRLYITPTRMLVTFALKLCHLKLFCLLGGVRFVCSGPIFTH